MVNRKPFNAQSLFISNNLITVFIRYLNKTNLYQLQLRRRNAAVKYQTVICNYKTINIIHRSSSEIKHFIVGITALSDISLEP